MRAPPRRGPLAGPTALLGAALAAFGGPLGAQADDDALRLMAETTSFTDVADAFDDDDPFDLNLHLEFVRSQTDARIQREVATPGALPGRPNYVDIADARHLVNTLVLGADVGLWHDLALYARLPLVLSDERSLRGLVNTPADVLASLPFSVPFTSPTRSGLDSLHLGAAWAITNQFRSPSSPTWVLMLEGRFALGPALRPCSSGTLTSPLDPTNSGTCRSSYGMDGAPRYDSGGPGVSRGTNGLRIETRASRRFRYVEPYAGLAFQIEWPAASERLFVPSGNIAGVVNTIPPILGTATAGVAIVPWEHRGRYQRFVIDARAIFTYVSEGRNWSPLFDALGTSSSRGLTDPRCEIDPGAAGCSPANPQWAALRKGYFYGLTDEQAHARLGGRVAVEMQAARYVRFSVAAGLFYTTAHLLTFADACNPNIDPQPGADGSPDPRQGDCRSGIINPNYRDEIDLPGRRFRLESALTFDLSASITAQF
jgi:hypothetical protein